MAQRKIALTDPDALVDRLMRAFNNPYVEEFYRSVAEEVVRHPVTGARLVTLLFFGIKNLAQSRGLTPVAEAQFNLLVLRFVYALTDDEGIRSDAKAHMDSSGCAYVPPEL